MAPWTIRHPIWTWIPLALAALAAAPTLAQPTFDELVDCRWAVEEVLWRHRIWPESNPGPKPPLAEVLSRDAVERRMDDALRQATALEEIWHAPLDDAALRGELDRMAKNSRDPQMLRELFAAAGSGERAALCLALPALVRNRLDAFYAQDAELHRALREEAELGLDRAPDVEGLAEYGAEVSVETFERASDLAVAERGLAPDGSRILDDDAWNALIDDLDQTFFGKPELPGAARRSPRTPSSADSERLPVRRRSNLDEIPGAFVAREIREKGADRLVVATALWRKISFDAWWSGRRLGFAAERPALAAAELPSVAGGACIDDTWSPTSLVDSLSKRYHHVAVWTGSEMLLWGGSIETLKYLDGRRYDPATDSWFTMTTTGAPTRRHVATAVWTGTQMIVWGGYDATYLGSGGRYNPASDSWSPVATSGAPSPRVWHTAVWTGSEMIVWGGYDDSYLSSGGRYAPATNTWSTLPLFPPTARAYHTAIWAGDRMIVWGGYNPNGPRNDGASFAPGGNWISLPSANAPAPRWDHTAVWTGSEMIVWGGFDGTNVLQTGGRFTVAGGWSSSPPTVAAAPTARRFQRAVWAGAPTQRMIVWGGYDGGPLGDGALYDPLADSWSAMTAAGAPEPRWGHSLVWTGSEAIVWGGGTTAAAGFFASGGRYDPAADRWRATSISAPLSPREDATSVWTGSELLVWGGYDGADLASGALYTAASDTWRPVAQGPATPAPSSWAQAVWTGTQAILFGGNGSVQSRYAPAGDSWSALPAAPVTANRRWHTATWTGTQMIVLGGQWLADASILEAGARYDPSANQWSPLAAGAGARFKNAAVWTGSELLVWGKPENPLVYSDGMRYFPLLQSWTPMNPNGSPVSRRSHSALWTRSKMIVWGGFDGQAPVASGALYDPVSDLWQPTAATGAPSPRLNHSAVWTGSELVIWGGESSFSELGTGARYDPQAGWVATSTSGAAAARRGHVTAWTGREMLVWGGWGDNELRPSGGRYCAYTPAIFHDDFEAGSFFWWSGHP